MATILLSCFFILYLFIDQTVQAPLETLKTVSSKCENITYEKRFIDGECMILYHNKLFKENDLLNTDNQWCKVSRCSLESVFYYLCTVKFKDLLQNMCRLLVKNNHLNYSINETTKQRIDCCYKRCTLSDIEYLCT
ncbi:unnamed protein product [Didymodactylos carnosus]|uniref:Insulin-like domain-containing protein n=1 Tax=Didymodactylos carnosus TaxID=1234261 RepID=A0A8S2WVU7_9BILA|nr:unnamed protein product [Didymodactylos carnosus]CAF4465117.1 unnamed protein product [Didymodactylos carnosus]